MSGTPSSSKPNQSPYVARKINRTVPSHRRYVRFALDNFERVQNQIVWANARYDTIRIAHSANSNRIVLQPHGLIREE